MTYLAVVDAGPPRLTGSEVNAWLVDGDNAKRSSCISSSGSGCIIVMVVLGVVLGCVHEFLEKVDGARHSARSERAGHRVRQPK